jgi:hypothetical protein
MTPTAIGAILHLIPAARPFFTPRERALTGLTNFRWEIRFFPLFSHRVCDGLVLQSRDFVIRHLAIS